MGAKPPIVPLLLVLSLGSATGAPPSSAREHDPTRTGPIHHRPNLRAAPALEPFLRHLTPGHDAFPEEKDAAELAARLDELGALLRESPARARDAAARLLAPEFKGGRLTGANETSLSHTPAFEVVRARAIPQDLGRNRTDFSEELLAFVREFGSIRTAELLITSIEVGRGPQPVVHTEVRYDIVGAARQGGRAERVGRWGMAWRRDSGGTWRVAEWKALDDVRSRARGPVFTEITDAALGGNASFQRQLTSGLDAWLATIDSVFLRDSMGHHGVSAGDADGDGLDDLYVSQPAGLPNRLFRNRGDGTFEDVTENAGLAVLDETAQSLFADLDNDGDQDLVLVAGSGLVLFTNDGKARFTREAEAFRFKRPLLGTPMAMAMADYDRDGVLDLYLCTYSYFVGASVDKIGTPAPYHDAQNGPPNVLLKGDGRGHFVDVTEESGLHENNDRYSFAAAWADYDEDGWPDLLVANDFGRKNLYRNQGLKDGKVTFKDVTAAAGVEDHGAGMSASWLDFDQDGHLDIYTGNMWSSAGQRITALPGFMPEAPAEVRALYRRHARGNSLFRNRGDGTFEDVTLAAHAEMGRWAWSSDVVDFDNDGSEDLYVVNGMFTREKEEEDLDGFFWRHVVARSPLTRLTGSPYDDAWRALNRILAQRSQANHQRNVLLRNDGRGGFDEVSGTASLDLDQDGRSFAVLDHDGDGDVDLAIMAARSSPQLRLFRNDLAQKGGALALRLVGTKSNRDAVGARATVEADGRKLTRAVRAGSGFISQHSKELLFGLGASQRIQKLTVQWPSGATQVFSDVLANQRLRLEEGDPPRAEPLRAAPSPARRAAVTPAAPPSASWLYEPCTAPGFELPDLDGKARSLASLRGRPVVLLFWSSSSEPSRAALRELAGQQAAIARAGASSLAVALDPPAGEAQVRAAAQGAVGLPVVFGNEEVGTTYTLLNRYLFVGKEDLRLPTVFLLNAQGEIVKAYRGLPFASQVVADIPAIDAAPAERQARALPFPGQLSSPPGTRNDLQYALELVEQGFDAPALDAFERAAKGDPSAFTLYSLGTLYMKKGQPAKAEAAFRRALSVKPDFSEASNGLGALVAQNGNVPAAIALFRAALETTPDYPDAMNNLGYALLQTGQDQEGHVLFEKALALQPDFPEAYNNLGIFFARQGELPQAEAHFQQAVDKRPHYGEAANNLALILMMRDQAEAATAVLQRLIQVNPDFEATYLTLSKIYRTTGRDREALQALEQLLQRNPKHPGGLQMLKELKGP